MVTDISAQIRIRPYAISVFSGCHTARVIEGSRHRFIDSTQARLIS
jgi:hypothetical protein